MEKRDARKLSPTAQREVRRQAVVLWKNGMSKGEIAAQLDVHRNTVGKWLSRYRQAGMGALEVNKRGPKPGNTAVLSESEQAGIRKIITDKCPEQLKLPFALWTREAVGRLIEKRTGKALDLRQVGRYLKRWGFTVQRPTKQAYQRSDKAVEDWRNHEYPKIKALAQQEDAEIQWLDESGIKSHDHRGRGYAPKGQTPVRKHNPCGEKINQISSITNQGKLRFMCYEGSFNYRTFHQFLSRLLREANGRKIHVIADNLRVHHSKVIRRWVRRYAHLIQLHYLPSYCPDLNPDEYLNCDLKTELAKRPERREKGQWARIVENTLEALAANPLRIRKYFQAKPIRYAA